jgi:adenylosuccinate synthase
MSLWVIVGGQYGSEGKGKVSAFIAKQENLDICVRCGGRILAIRSSTKTAKISSFANCPQGLSTRTLGCLSLRVP